MKLVRLSASRTGRLYPQEMFLVLVFTRGWVDPRAMVRSEGNMSLKNPVTSPGIDSRTVRLVAQRLNHYPTPVEYIKINTIFGDTVPSRYEFLSKVLIQLSDQTQLYMSSTLVCPFILFVCIRHYLMMADLDSRNTWWWIKYWIWMLCLLG
jgi:hypothetical protein